METPGEKRRQAHYLEAQPRLLEAFSVARCSSPSSRLQLHLACSAPAQRHRRLVAFSAQLSSSRNRLLDPACLVGRLGRTSNSSNSHNNSKAQVCGVRRRHNSSRNSSSRSSHSSSVTACSVLRCSLRLASIPTRHKAYSRLAKASHSCDNRQHSRMLVLQSPVTVCTSFRYLLRR